MSQPKKKGSVKKIYPRKPDPTPVGVPHRDMNAIVVCTERQVQNIQIHWHRIFGPDWRELGAEHLFSKFDGWIYTGATEKPEELAQQEAIRYTTILLGMPNRQLPMDDKSKAERKALIASYWPG
jgi:hypothetical protein